MIAPALLLLVLQANGWVATPSQPTVGDTIQLERIVSTTPGWRVRAGKLASGTVAEPLGDAVVLAAPGAWVVRYAVVPVLDRPDEVLRALRHLRDLTLDAQTLHLR